MSANYIEICHFRANIKKRSPVRLRPESKSCISHVEPTYLSWDQEGKNRISLEGPRKLLSLVEPGEPQLYISRGPMGAKIVYFSWNQVSKNCIYPVEPSGRKLCISRGTRRAKIVYLSRGLENWNLLWNQESKNCIALAEPGEKKMHASRGTSKIVYLSWNQVGPGMASKMVTRENR